MGFKIDNPSQCLEFHCHIAANVYDKLNKNSQKVWIRLVTPLVLIGDALAFLITQVATIGERILKGLGNLFIAAFSKYFDPFVGIKQIFAAPLSAAALALSTIALPFYLIKEIFVSALHHQQNTQRFKDINIFYEGEFAKGVFFPKLPENLT